MYQVILRHKPFNSNNRADSYRLTPRRFQRKEWAEEYLDYLLGICRKEYTMIRFWLNSKNLNVAGYNLMQWYGLSKEEVTVVMLFTVNAIRNASDTIYFGGSYEFRVVDGMELV